MPLYISVVSHGHFELIKKLGCLSSLSEAKEFTICVLDNVGESGFKDWCQTNKIHYLLNEYVDGFGANNNKVFSFFKNRNDFSIVSKFLVLNPDVVITTDSLKSLVDTSNNQKAKISAINLFKNPEMTQFDHSVRRYSSFTDYVGSILFGRNPSIMDKAIIHEPTFVDWAAGSCLLFDSSHFDQLGGFDERYFMYCEDIDICLRSDYYYNEKVLYCPEVKAVHYAQHASRSLFSKHLFWHLSSIYKYLKTKRKLEKEMKNKRQDA